MCVSLSFLWSLRDHGTCQERMNLRLKKLVEERHKSRKKKSERVIVFGVEKKLHIHSITVTTSRTTEIRHSNSCHDNQHPSQPSVWQLSAVYN